MGKSLNSAILLVFLLTTNGCGTTYSFLDGAHLKKNLIYSGVRIDFKGISSEKGGDIALGIIDFPFSLIADTLLLPVTITDMILKHESPELKEAKNRYTPPEKLAKLSQSTSSSVRVAVAKNGNTPYEVLEKLSKDENKLVREGVASHPNTQTVILERLSQDEEDSVRVNVARNRNTPVATLKKLSEDRNENVRKDAIKSLNSKKLQ